MKVAFTRTVENEAEGEWEVTYGGRFDNWDRMRVLNLLSYRAYMYTDNDSDYVHWAGERLPGPDLVSGTIRLDGYDDADNRMDAAEAVITSTVILAFTRHYQTNA